MEERVFNFRYVRLYHIDIPEERVEPFANSGDPDQLLHSAVSDLGLHCLPVTRLGVSSLQWVNMTIKLQNNCIKKIDDNYVRHHRGRHIVFSAHPVSIGVASCLHSISLMNGWILAKLTQIYHWVV